MATSGPDLLVASYQALASEERDEAFQRIHNLRVEAEAGTESEMARFVRSLRRVAEEVGRTPTADDYREVQPRLAAAGETVESFSRLYRFFGSWPRAREALDLSETQTPRRIDARFRVRRLGKIWRYDEDDLRDALARAVEHWGYPPTTTEFDWWRQQQLELAKATGRQDVHLPSATPYRSRWGTWEAALLHFGYSPEELARRLTSKNNIITKDHNPDAFLLAGLPMATLADGCPAALPLDPAQVDRLRGAYSELPRRSRYILTVRLGLAADTLTLRRAAEPLALHLGRVSQLQVIAVETLIDAVAPDEARDRPELRDAITESLRALAVSGST